AQLGRAEGINSFTGFLFSQVPSGRPVQMDEILKRAEAIVDKRFANDEALAVDLLTTIGQIYLIREDYDNGRRVLKHAYEASQRPADPGVRANASCYWARIVASDGDFTG